MNPRRCKALDPYRTRFSILLLLTASLLVAGGARAQSQLPGEAFTALIDRYLLEVMGVDSLDAGAPPTQRGDAALKEMSAAGFARRLETMQAVLRDLQSIDRSALTFDDQIDYRFLEGTLRADILVAEKVQRWRQDPRLYFNNGPIVYKIAVDPRQPDVRARGLISDLALLQVRLANAQKNLDQYIARWIELTQETLDGFRSVLVNDLGAFANRVEDPTLRADLAGEADRALSSLNRFATFLREDLPKRPVGDYRVGAEVFNGLQEHRYMFPKDDINLRRIARGDKDFTRVPAYREWGLKQFDIVKHHLEVKARKIDPTRSWLEILRDEKEDHFFAEQLVYKHLEATRATRDWVIDNNLVTIPWEDDDAIMTAADPSMWASQWWGFGPGVAPDSPTRKSACCTNPWLL